ncbi:MAG: hypothetical protein IPQ13_15330 [Holophagaceae bacterium]|nr:hypothetical protein [Holophagaceae bacterium]
MLEDAFRSGGPSAVLDGIHKVGEALGPLHKQLVPDGKIALYSIRDILYRLWNPNNIDIWTHQTEGQWDGYENQLAQDIATRRLGRQCCSSGDLKVWKGIIEELRQVDPTIDVLYDILS